jgi:hypothetical protein
MTIFGIFSLEVMACWDHHEKQSPATFILPLCVWYSRRDWLNPTFITLNIQPPPYYFLYRTIQQNDAWKAKDECEQ